MTRGGRGGLASHIDMPLYEYYCRRCDGQLFELLRPSARMDEPAACPEGHASGKRVLSSFAAPSVAAPPGRAK